MDGPFCVIHSNRCCSILHSVEKQVAGSSETHQQAQGFLIEQYMVSYGPKQNGMTRS